ncbi:MAG TPA: RluA family pseudouridine synthase [Actinomycetota bacterium]|nr:RluA family pseudouridine synthase [Actinomycetota bacterium]
MTLVVEATPGRLDAVVAELAGLPRADVQRAISRGSVLVDGVARPKSFRLRGGERIEADLAGPAEVGPEPGGLPVLYQDDHLAVVVKPAGMVTHPTASRRSGTVVNRLLGMELPLSGLGGPDRPGIVHRLDAGTSGLLAVAKDDETYRRFTAMLAAHEVVREYLALVRGEVPHGAFTVEAPLGRDRARVAVRRGTGVEAVTDFEVRGRFRGATLLVARPRTGRTHQIRVHLRSIGHPVLGDRAYGGGGDDARRLGLSRPFLHAWRLAFAHPITGERIEVEEPLPDDLREALTRASSA